MNVSFDLTSEPWIPCILANGTRKELSLTDVLTRAPEIREVVAPSPLVTAALHRLLLAILHRIFGPRTRSEWREMWEAGRWDEGRLRAYLEDWRHRFDLFDKDRPFYQTPGLPHKMNPSPISILACEQSSKSSTTLFDHHDDHIAPNVSPAEAACLVVANQAFSLGGLCSREKGGNPSAKDAPIARAAIVLVIGDTLFETLMLNMVRYDVQRGFPFSGQSADDAPAWEQDSPAAVEERLPRGYLDYLTWQSRRIWLGPEVDKDGDLQVRQGIIADGRRFPDNVFPSEMETMTARIPKPNAKSGQDPRGPLRLRQSRAVWRDSTALLQSIAEGDDKASTIRPRTIDWLGELVDTGVIDKAKSYSISIIGMCSKPGQKKIYFWRHERQPLPLTYLTDEDLVDDLGVALRIAEEAARALTSALWPIGCTLVGPDQANDNEAVRQKLSQSLPGLPLYWSSLEPKFYGLLVGLPGDYDHRERELEKWAKIVESTVWRAFDESIRALPTGIKFLRAEVTARNNLARKLYGDVLSDFKEVDYAQADRA